jgi:hypothetical protein
MTIIYYADVEQGKRGMALSAVRIADSIRNAPDPDADSEDGEQ